MNSPDLPSYGTNSRKRLTLRLLSMYKEGGAFEVVLPGKRANQLPQGRKSLPGRTRVEETIQINYKINFIQESFQRFSLHFQQLLQFCCITHKMHFSEHVCGNVLEELVFLYRESFHNILQYITFLKMLFFHKYFSAIFRSFSNFFQSISTSHSGVIQVHTCF